MTAQPIAADAARPQAPRQPDGPPAAASASWWARAVALAVDVAPGAAVAATTVLVASTVPLGGAWWWSCLIACGAAIAATAANRVVLPGAIGWSLGRAAMGIAVVRGGVVAEPVGVRRLFWRELAHLLDTASALVGWVWPLWDRRGRTFADMLARTEVRRAQTGRPPGMPAVVAAVFSAAALVCVAAATVSFAGVYRPDRATDAARQQIGEQGPRIVEHLLSYAPDTLDEDFERARAVATDGYLEQLVPRQQAVREGAATTNQYWATNASVVAATPDEATMLVFMQGQRGDENNNRPISATVRVTFARCDDQWRVDELTVVTKPMPANPAEPEHREGGN